MIKKTSLSQLENQTKGQLSGSDTFFDSVSIDTRSLKTGDLFIAIKGDKFDGHQYLSQAIQQGCCAVVISDKQSVQLIKNNQPKGQVLSTLFVDDTKKALGKLAQLNRCDFKGAVVGLTGSTGKTTTKNMLATILREEGAVCATEGNLNNEIGVPLTLLSIEPAHDYAVVEMGARTKGDIRYLSEYVRADVAIVLNAGLSHIDVFGSYENIVKTKGEILEVLAEGGIAIVNADDPAVDTWRASVKGEKVLSFSLTESTADVYASAIKCDVESSRYTLNYLGSSQEINLPMPGKHNVSNSLAAAAGAIVIGFDLKTIATGLSNVQSIAGRLKTIKLSNNVTLIDDTYNANPVSMKASLDVLSLRQGYKVAVLGEMAELGKQSLGFHLELAKYAGKTPINHFYFIGQYSDQMAACFKTKATACKTKKEIFDLVCESIVEGETILVKGSRSAEMDEFVGMFEGWAA